MVPVKVNVFPDNLLTIADYDVMMQSMGVQDSVVQMLKEYEAEPCMRPVLINSRDAFHAIMSVVKSEKNPLVIMGWHGSGLAKVHARQHYIQNASGGASGRRRAADT